VRTRLFEDDDEEKEELALERDMNDKGVHTVLSSHVNKAAEDPSADYSLVASGERRETRYIQSDVSNILLAGGAWSNAYIPTTRSQSSVFGSVPQSRFDANSAEYDGAESDVRARQFAGSTAVGTPLVGSDASTNATADQNRQFVAQSQGNHFIGQDPNPQANRLGNTSDIVTPARAPLTPGMAPRTHVISGATQRTAISQILARPPRINAEMRAIQEAQQGNVAARRGGRRMGRNPPDALTFRTDISPF
jgi:hypothetical protein